MKTKKRPTLKLVEVKKPYYNSNDCEKCYFNTHKIAGKCYCGADNFAEIAEKYVIMPRDEEGHIIDNCNGYQKLYIYVEEKKGGNNENL